VQPLAEFQSQLDPDPDHHFSAAHKQLYYGTSYFSGGDLVPATMSGFVQSYYDQQRSVNLRVGRP
jgi:phospholipase C